MTRLEFSKLFPPCELTTNADPGISSSEYVIRGALFSRSVEMACQGQHVCAAGRYVEFIEEKESPHSCRAPADGQWVKM